MRSPIALKHECSLIAPPQTCRTNTIHFGRFSQGLTSSCCRQRLLRYARAGSFWLRTRRPAYACSRQLLVRPASTPQMTTSAQREQVSEREDHNFGLLAPCQGDYKVTPAHPAATRKPSHAPRWQKVRRTCDAAQASVSTRCSLLLDTGLILLSFLVVPRSQCSPCPVLPP